MVFHFLFDFLDFILPFGYFLYVYFCSFFWFYISLSIPGFGVFVAFLPLRILRWCILSDICISLKIFSSTECIVYCGEEFFSKRLVMLVVSSFATSSDYSIFMTRTFSFLRFDALTRNLAS